MKEKYFSVCITKKHYSGHGDMIVHNNNVVEGAISDETYFIGMIVDKVLILRLYMGSTVTYDLKSDEINYDFMKISSNKLPLFIDVEVDDGEDGFISIQRKLVSTEERKETREHINKTKKILEYL